MAAASDILEGEDAVLWNLARESHSADAREQLFSRHAAFAKAIARRIYHERKGGDIELADLNQLAFVGLMEALGRYDPTKGVPFRGFAAARIRGNIIDGIARMTERREQLSWRHRQLRERMRSLDIAGHEGMETAEAMDTLADLALGLALGFMLEGTGLYVDDEQDTGPNAYESLVWQNIMDCLTAEMSRIPEREQAVLRHHYIGGLGFDQLGSLLGVSKGRISQLHRTALDRLRKAMNRNGHFRLEQ